MARIWLGIKFLRGLKMTSLSDNGEEKKKTRPLWHIKSWRCGPQPNILHEIHFNSADCRLKAIMFSIRKRRGHISAKQPKDYVHKAAMKSTAYTYKNKFSNTFDQHRGQSNVPEEKREVSAQLQLEHGHSTDSC